MEKQIYLSDARMGQNILISKYMTYQQNEEQIQSSQFKQKYSVNFIFLYDKILNKEQIRHTKNISQHNEGHSQS